MPPLFSVGDYIKMKEPAYDANANGFWRVMSVSPSKYGLRYYSIRQASWGTVDVFDSVYGVDKICELTDVIVDTPDEWDEAPW